MKIFVETANLQQIDEAAEMGLLDGVCTNPSLLAREGVVGYDGMMHHYQTICQYVECDVLTEVIATEFEGMMLEAQALAALHYQIVVKIPATRQGIKAIKYLADKGIRTCATLVFSLGQAVWAAKAGAAYVSPMVSRVDDASANGIILIHQIAEAFGKYRFNTEILASSIHSTKNISDCIESAVENAAIPIDLLLKALDHPLTEIGLSHFLDDFNRLN